MLIEIVVGISCISATGTALAIIYKNYISSRKPSALIQLIERPTNERGLWEDI
jgi:hypothetical protein